MQNFHYNRIKSATEVETNVPQLNLKVVTTWDSVLNNPDFWKNVFPISTRPEKINEIPYLFIFRRKRGTIPWNVTSSAITMFQSCIFFAAR